MLVNFMYHDVKLFDDFRKFLIRHTAIYYLIAYKLEKKCAKFIWSCLNSHHCVLKNIALSATSSSSSDFGDYYRYLSYKYNIGIDVWNLPLCKLYKYVDLYLSHNPDGTFIRELCLFKDDYFLIDNNDITKEELSHTIKHFSVS